jgi:coenzyme F420 hydrogenase subunit beta
MKTWTLADVAGHWDRSPGYDQINAKIDSYFRRFTDSAPLFALPENAKVLDVDCRTGKGTIFFKEKFPTAEFTCMASAPTFKSRAEKNLRDRNIDAKVHLLCDPPFPFTDESFDAVLSYETLEHIPWPERYLEELGRVTKPGGVLVLTTPNVLWEPVHWLSATLHLDHGEGPHRMVPRNEILDGLYRAGFDVRIERTFVLVPAGPSFLLKFGRWLESWLPKAFLRAFALRRTYICTKTEDPWWRKLQVHVVDPGLETQCGTAVGLSQGTLCYTEKNGIPVLTRTEEDSPVPRAAFEGCAAHECNFPRLNDFLFHKQPTNWLSGVVEKSYVGYASEDGVRRAGASGGVISRVLIHLLESKMITGAVCLKMGARVPHRAEPVIARTKEEVLACAQSVYSVTPVNTILSELEHEEGPLAFVGLPDQVAAIRKLQKMNHPSVRSIRFVIGPYTGTQMYFEAIRSFLRSHGVKSENEIAELRYRAGEWPGHLRITLKTGRVLEAEKFHYNYLIPFFITQSSLQLVDFTNELADISVGDAWSPKYESQGGGYSVVLARSPDAVHLLETMRAANELSLKEISLPEALDMHGHMLDFKKRGSFIRNKWRHTEPNFGYRPTHIPASRYMIERVLWLIFAIGRKPFARWTVEHLPISVVGPCFNVLRKTWKNLSKPTKRKGLRNMQFTVE